MANQSSTPFDQGLFLVHLNRGREHFDQRNFIDAAEDRGRNYFPFLDGRNV